MTEEATRHPELRPLIGALIFGAKHAVSVRQIKQTLAEVADVYGGETRAFAGAREADIEAAIAQLRESCEKAGLGFQLVESADGYRFQSDPAHGSWLRHILDEQQPARLSRPAVETLAIIAYRQPIIRSEIEAVRGVNVDHIIKLLMEMQLIRIVGRSELPGRPLMYGTTATFLEHFGLKEVKQLPGIEELSRLELERIKKTKQPAVAEAAAEPGAGETAGAPGPAEPDGVAATAEAAGESCAAEPASAPEGEPAQTSNGSDDAEEELEEEDEEDDDDDEDEEEDDEEIDEEDDKVAGEQEQQS